MVRPIPSPESAPQPLEGDNGLPWTPEARAELEALHEDLDREIQETGAVCWQKGDCCNFVEVEHVLFASSLEIAYVRELHPRPFFPKSPHCPFWIDRICHLRERRPLGCRTYFCDSRYRDVLQDIHERYHGRLKDIARRHGLPWSYVPFVMALRAPSAVPDEIP